MWGAVVVARWRVLRREPTSQEMALLRICRWACVRTRQCDADPRRLMILLRLAPVAWLGFRSDVATSNSSPRSPAPDSAGGLGHPTYPFVGATGIESEDEALVWLFSCAPSSTC